MDKHHIAIELEVCRVMPLDACMELIGRWVFCVSIGQVSSVQCFVHGASLFVYGLCDVMVFPLCIGHSDGVCHSNGVCVCVFFPFILDFNGRTSRGHTGRR